MHPNHRLMEQLYQSLNRRDPEAMAACYHPAATFHDIAFHLHGKDRIRQMWQMICSGDISATFEVVSADDSQGVVQLVDNYTFSDTGNKVRNPIESRFRFLDGLIVEHRDSCDERAWATAALGGGILGFLAGRFRFMRALKAHFKLRKFIRAKARHDTGVRRVAPSAPAGTTGK